MSLIYTVTTENENRRKEELWLWDNIDYEKLNFVNFQKKTNCLSMYY